MTTFLIMAQTHVRAMQIMRALTAAGLYATVVKPPASITQGECSNAVKVAERQIYEVLRVVKAANVPYGKIYRQNADGTVDEMNFPK